ncbi:MAG: hypothetical protein WCJ74_00915 [bacterium]
MKINKVVYLGKHTSGLNSHKTYEIALVVVEETGYLVNLETDGRGQRLCFDHAFQSSYGRSLIGKQIGENRHGLLQVILCEPFCLEGDYLKSLSIDNSFHNMDDDKVQKIKDFLSEQYQTIISEIQKANYRKNRIAEVKELLQKFRYQDAKAHCQAFGLDYDELILTFIKSHK